MKKFGAILGGAVILSVVALSLGALGVGSNSEDDEGPLAPLSADAAQDFSLSDPPPALSDAIAVAADHTVYFFPLDTNTSTTVIFLVNTGSTTATIYRYYYRSDGSLYASGGTVISPGHSAVRASDDTLAGDVVWNFTTATAYVKLVLPQSIVLDGYIGYKSSTANFDISLSTNMRPLVFFEKP